MLVKVENNIVIKYPYTDIELMLDNPNVSFPAVITQETREHFGVYIVTSAVPPECNEFTQKIVEVDPVFLNGVWFQTWEIVDLSDEEKAYVKQKKADEYKVKRDQELVKSDFTQIADVLLLNKSEWATYRQQLRDLPQQPNFPENVVWPRVPLYKY